MNPELSVLLLFPARSNVNPQPWYFYFLISRFYSGFPFLYKKKVQQTIKCRNCSIHYITMPGVQFNEEIELNELNEENY